MILVKVMFYGSLFVTTLGDPMDWASVDYVIAKGKGRRIDSSTADAEAAIIRGADKYANGGPQSVVNPKGVLPPSGDGHDYLSWAPYHWPDCNWCPAGKTHLAHTVDTSRGNNSYDGPPSSAGVSYSSYGQDDPYQYLARLPERLDSYVQNREVNNGSGIPSDLPTQFPTSTPTRPAMQLPSDPPLDPAGPPVRPTPAKSTAGRAPAQAAAKTTMSPCTPSPTRQLSPSATWTSCSYVVRDGQVNPDVRTLHGPGTINSAAQAILYNALSSLLGGPSSHSKNVADFIQTFFLTPETKVNPNVNYGQIVRGPGEEGRQGKFTGILDFRGMIQVANGVEVLRAAKSASWTPDKDNAIKLWAANYTEWLSINALARMAASRPNNHGSFFYNQMAALWILNGDRARALNALRHYFQNQFLDQIAASGEQPFEAIRTRPIHYRAFNLEAMITNAKLGDQLGANFWIVKSKYGATMQTALDFLIALDPKNENSGEIAPHVANIAAAYGDPSGKYAAYLAKHDPSYKSKPYWLYSQPAALSNAPTSHSKRSVVWRREDAPVSPSLPGNAAPVPSSVPFECPAVFDKVMEVEIDNGIFVTCDEVRPFYIGSQTSTGSSAP